MAGKEGVKTITGKGGERGFALILAVWVLAILAAISAEFLFSSRLRIQAERSMREQLQAYALALAGYNAALDLLGEDYSRVSRDEDGILMLHAVGEEEGMPALLEDQTLGAGSWSFQIEDEEGKIAINRQQRPVLSALLGETGHPPGEERDGIVDSILDWIDANREHHLNGAEEDYYRGLDPPYSSKDGPFDARSELLLVRGMREEYYFGGTAGEKDYLPLRDYVTAHALSFNPATASEIVLQALGQPRAAASRSAVMSRFFSVTATGKVGEGGGERRILAVVRRDAAGGKNTFRLLYWNDNYSPKGPVYAVD